MKEYEALVDQIVRGICFNYPDVHREDIEPRLWEYINGYGSEVPAFGPGVSAVLRRLAQKAASKVRAGNLRVSSQYTYLVSDVYRLAETIFDDSPGEGWCPQDAQTLERDAMAAVEVRMDLKRSLDKLDWEHRGAIIRRYRLGIVPERGTAEQRKLSRAIKALQEEMNSIG